MKTMPSLGSVVRINIQKEHHNYILQSFNNGQDVYVVGVYSNYGIYVNERKSALTRSIDTILIPLDAVIQL